MDACPACAKHAGLMQIAQMVDLQQRLMGALAGGMMHPGDDEDDVDDDGDEEEDDDDESDADMDGGAMQMPFLVLFDSDNLDWQGCPMLGKDLLQHIAVHVTVTLAL